MPCSNPLVVSFAADVTKRLTKIAPGVVAKGDGRSFCQLLAAALLLVNEYLNDQKAVSPVSISRLDKLLSNLERICKSPNGRTVSQRLRLSRVTKENLAPALRYPELNLLCQGNHKNAVDGIRHLACRRGPEGEQKQNDLLKFLGAFTASVDETPSMNKKNGIPIGDDFSGSIRTLYRVLSSYIFCNAANEQTQIAGRLRLAFGSVVEGNFPAFDMMFLAHPHHELMGQTFRWRQTLISVDRRKIKIAPIADQGVHLDTDSLAHVVDFCEKISTNDLFPLSLRIYGEQLHIVGSCDREKLWLPNTPSVSLCTILKNHKLSQKTKYLLSYLLAKSVWQLYSTEWMDRYWTKDAIYFMYERRHGAENIGIYLNEPFISACFDKNEKGNDDPEFRPHKLPRIKALGIMLLEIELGTVIEDHYKAECYAPDGKLYADADLHTASRLYDNPDMLENTTLPLKKAIETCLRPSKFMQCRHSVENLRKVLQEEVVDHLHFLIELYGEPDKIDLQPTIQMQQAQQFTQPHHSPKSITPQSPPLAANIAVAENHQVTHERPVAYTGSVASCIKDPSSKDWFEELDQLNEVICQQNEIDQDYKRVRVAVIDTGIEGSDTYARHIRGYRDFVTDNDDVKQDKTGHGTNSVKLIYKVYADAEIYVARVFENEMANDNTQDLMLRAIEHAKKVWEVNIISIASGFEKDHPSMRRAIKEAVSAGIVVFAAASNYGNIRQVAFPARMQEVICMYCTDGRAKLSQSINPAAQTTKTKNFAILGEGVSLTTSARELLTGTSVATSIAAGLAGRLLDFSRQSDCRGLLRCVGNLASVEGMSAVFSLMTLGAKDHEYDCVVPGRLLQHLDEYEERATKRARICERLSHALENINLNA